MSLRELAHSGTEVFFCVYGERRDSERMRSIRETGGMTQEGNVNVGTFARKKRISSTHRESGAPPPLSRC